MMAHPRYHGVRLDGGAVLLSAHYVLLDDEVATVDDPATPVGVVDAIYLDGMVQLSTGGAIYIDGMVDTIDDLRAALAEAWATGAPTCNGMVELSTGDMVAAGDLVLIRRDAR